MHTTHSFLNPEAAASVPQLPDAHGPQDRERPDCEWPASFDPMEDYFQELELELRLIQQELDSDAEDFNRAHEEGWFYSDED